MQLPSKLEDIDNQPIVEFSQEILQSFKFRTPKEELKKRLENIKIVGHRGGFKPDNSMRGFMQAQQHGCKYVELDVYISKDEQVFVIHAGHKGEMDHFVKEKGTFISEYNSDKLQQITINEHGDKMPLLKDVMIYFKQHGMYPLIELKGDNIKLCECTIDVILETDMQGQCEIITFAKEGVLECQRILKLKDINNVPVTQVYKNLPIASENPEEYVRVLTTFDTDSVSMNASEMNKDLLEQAKRIRPNLVLNCWWARHIYRTDIKQENFQEYVQALDCPLDAITVDFPIVMKQIIDYLLKNQQQ